MHLRVLFFLCLLPFFASAQTSTNAPAPSSMPAKPLLPRGEILDRHGEVLAKDDAASGLRIYPCREMACHVIGYVGTSTNVSEMGATVGRTGVEASMDGVLRNSSSQVILSIDKRIQTIVEQAMGHQRGACVVLDPRNGDVLAMSSWPAFDPNQFIPVLHASDWEHWVHDERTPLLNRAVRGEYAPGSVFKLITALAALEAGFNHLTEITCEGRFKSQNLEFKCWEPQGHETLDLQEALTVSCNVYFYSIARTIGHGPIVKMAEAFGLGKPTGISLIGESSGLVPTEHWWMTHRKARPIEADTLNVAIGQGPVLVTPLQMACMAAAYANQTTLYQPRLVLSTRQGAEVKEYPSRAKGPIPGTLENVQFIRECMANVVKSGTGAPAQLAEIQVAGKTGSAQFSVRDGKGNLVKDTRAWMISFAPFDSPRYAMALVIEGGESGGATAAPIAGKIYEKLFQNPE